LIASEKYAGPLFVQKLQFVHHHSSYFYTLCQIFDATHAEGKQNGLLWKLGETTVIPGLNEVVANMRVGEKVQAILPPNMAFGDDGICLENGECLIKPGATLVYDVTLKKTSIPPP